MRGYEESKNMRGYEESKNMRGYEESKNMRVKNQKIINFLCFSTLFSFGPLTHLLKTLIKKLLPSRKLDLSVNCAGLLLVPD